MKFGSRWAPSILAVAAATTLSGCGTEGGAPVDGELKVNPIFMNWNWVPGADGTTTPLYAGKTMYTITVLDKKGNPLNGVPIGIEAQGGLLYSCTDILDVNTCTTLLPGNFTVTTAFGSAFIGIEAIMDRALITSADNYSYTITFSSGILKATSDVNMCAGPC